MKWTQKTALIAGLALIVTVNLAALGGAAYNRAGEPESVLGLTQRELQPPYASVRTTENSGLTLQLRWRVLPQEEPKSVYWFDGEGGGTPAWLDAAKMAELGFDAKAATRRSGERPLPRDVYVVLELEGPAYQQALGRARRVAAAVASKNERGEGAKDAREMIDREERRNSRLFAIDAGLDREALRAKYPDRKRHAIVRGQVRKGWEASGVGRIDGLSADELNVPLEMRAVFAGVSATSRRPSEDEAWPRFEARVAFGQRLEPWIVAATGK